MRKLSHQEIVGRQKELLKQPRLPFCVVLNDIRSAYNVGSIFRTADGAGVAKLWLCGITGFPPNKEIAKTALGAQTHVPWEYRQDVVSLIEELKEKGYEIVLLEQTQASIPYEGFFPQKPVCLVIGHEVSGISEGIVQFCDCAVEIEMQGLKNSLNVAVAFGIVAYHIRTCLKKAAPAGYV